MTALCETSECACDSPDLVVEIGGFRYVAVPLDAAAVPCCSSCDAPYTRAWKQGPAVDRRNLDQCGMPKKDGSPCGWVTRIEPCPYHRTPEQQEEERARLQAEAEEKRRQAAEDLEEHRRGLIGILTVSCPHCGVPAGELCRSLKGLPQRGLHGIRRRVSGWIEPKSFVLRSDRFSEPGSEPPLDVDLRAVLNDPLEDRTPQAEARFEEEAKEKQARRVQEARRKLWLAVEPRQNQILAIVCPLCNAGPDELCLPGGRRVLSSHLERADAVMEAERPTAL